MPHFTPAATLALYPGRWVALSRPAPERDAHDRYSWRAYVYASKADMALDLWRELANPYIELQESPHSEAALSFNTRYAAYGAREDAFERLAFSPQGASLSLWSLIDYGEQIAAERSDFAYWEAGYSAYRRLEGWSGSGPVPGTGRKGQYRWHRRQERSLRLGLGQRARMISAILESARDPLRAYPEAEAKQELDDFIDDGALWAWLPDQRGALLRSAKKIARVFCGPYDDYWSSPRERRSWKSHKARKSWGGGARRAPRYDAFLDSALDQREDAPYGSEDESLP